VPYSPSASRSAKSLVRPVARLVATRLVRPRNGTSLDRMAWTSRSAHASDDSVDRQSVGADHEETGPGIKEGFDDIEPVVRHRGRMISTGLDVRL
jgi:hypothetical protein